MKSKPTFRIQFIAPYVSYWKTFKDYTLKFFSNEISLLTINKSGAEIININTQVVALIPLASLKNPAKIAPTIPPISKTIDNSALCSGDKGAEKIFKNIIFKIILEKMQLNAH